MEIPSAEQLTRKTCTPCEGGAESLTPEQATALLASVSGWELTADGKRIRRTWTAKGFMAAIDFFNKVAALAEKEGHHPDLHLEAYRHVTIELWTHAVGGLSENDFILAAKISAVPIALRRG